METEVQTNAPICKTQICKRPLTYLEDSKCWRCLECNPIPKDTPIPKKEKKFLDVAMTEKRVKEIIAEGTSMSEEKIREIVQDELMNWHIQKPPITRDETKNLTATEIESERMVQEVNEPPNWRQQAKELGIPLMKEPKGTGARRKVDVLADIEIAQKVGV